MTILSELSVYLDKNLPPGVIIPGGVSAIPDGFLECNGSAISRTTYQTLFSVIGTTYGPGDGSTTFNLPDLRGIFPRGVGSQTISAVNYDGSTLGTKRKDRTNHTGLSASTSSTNSATVGNHNSAHTHSWADRYFTGATSTDVSYSDPPTGDYDVPTSYTNPDVSRNTGNPNTSLNHTHTVATNTVSSSSSFNAEDTDTTPGYLTVTFLIRV